MASPETGPGARLLGESLLTLEVSTILKSNMTAEPMPALPHALLDLAIDYCVKIEELGTPRAEIATALFGETARDWAPGKLRAALAPTFDRFGTIRKLARELCSTRATAREAAGDRLATAEEVTLDRIVQACEIIMRVLRTLPRDSLLWSQLGMTRDELLGIGAEGRAAPRLGPYPELDPADLMDLKKLWDVGTEQIVAQTTIHITGDVTMRVTPALLKPENRLLLEIHREAVATSTAYWRELLNTAVALATGAARALFGGRAGGMSPLRDLLAQGSFLVLTDWPGRGVVLGTRITLGGDVLVAVSPGFAVAPDGGAIALHRERVEAALAGVRRVQRRIRIGAWCAAAAPSLLAGASAGLAAGPGSGLVAYGWAAGAALLAAPFWRWARGLGLRLAWRVVQRRLFSAG